MQFLILIGLNLAFAVAIHLRTIGLLVPSLVSGFLSAVTFHGIGYFIDGSINSLALISLLTTSGLGALVSLAIGALARSSGKKPFRG